LPPRRGLLAYQQVPGTVCCTTRPGRPGAADDTGARGSRAPTTIFGGRIRGPRAMTPRNRSADAGQGQDGGLWSTKPAGCGGGDPALGSCLNMADSTYTVLMSPIPASNV